jgi:competence protein ComEA
VNINTADATLLDTLPGIGPSKAAAIVDYRTKNGPFTAIADIQKVKGIGPATFANLKDSITVSVSVVEGPQPSVEVTSYEEKAVEPVVQKESIINTSNTEPHEEAIDAPAVANDLATAGAALPAPASRASGLLSVWTFGLLGVILVAGGAFILI